MQVEEQDLIEFSERQQKPYQQRGAKGGCTPTASGWGGGEGAKGTTAPAGGVKGEGDKAPYHHHHPPPTVPPKPVKPAEDVYDVGEDDLEDLEEDDEIETGSARTADEQMDYLESLEHCPCYAKCICDSIITLFCVTLLG